MYLRETTTVFLTLVLFSFIAYTYFDDVHGGTFTAKWISKSNNSTEEVSSKPLPKINNNLGEDSKKRTIPPKNNDWTKDCVIPNTTAVDNSRYSSCLSKLDFSEKMDCDTSCQESIQMYRKLNTRRACINNSKSLHSSIWDGKGNLEKSQLSRLGHLYPIENSKLIFCYIPKSGCTAWKRILLTVNGDISSPNAYKGNIHPLFKTKIRSLASYNVMEAQRRLETYKKFLFVREPLERLLSVFLDKALKERILNFNESQYENFLKFIIKEPLRFISNGFEEHWTHASNLCLPCDVSYDFIGRLETSKRDTQFIFDRFILKNRDRLKMYRDPNHMTNSSEKKKRYYQEVSSDVLRKTIDKYHIDYVLFNYDKPLV